LDSLLDQAAPTPAIDSDPASANASASASASASADADASEPERAEAGGLEAEGAELQAGVSAETDNPGSGGAADLAEQAPASAIAAANQPEPPAASDQAG
jgi:hypothetical protein